MHRYAGRVARYRERSFDNCAAARLSKVRARVDAQVLVSSPPREFRDRHRLMPMMLSSIYNWLSGAGFGDRAWAFEQGMPQGAGSPLMVTGALRGRGQLPIGRAQPRYGLPLSWATRQPGTG
jgi:hypothetical protein